MHILKRDYDVTTDKIKGIEKLNPEQVKIIDKCKLSREIVVLDETRYILNDDGEPVMTRDAQKEYDEFVSHIRETLIREDTKVLDEGYGVGEDELEWHITACVMDNTDSEVVGIMEIDTCVRTDDNPKSK